MVRYRKLMATADNETFAACRPMLDSLKIKNPLVWDLVIAEYEAEAARRGLT